ncbi:hypothetical protein JI435_434050 [Parastagonospora nodorum SN15]|uniref:Uncharacterized protein n=1 Tax=Phaeosphaeria nodorum (strain SN15 / ATCC MYA-4574 / FGSC 10173) TaxID=321614 RepID=A0A7U2I1V7_PHANO|nr:hypothetical protein JI435_434050 [Parastagonospora nodorum SN15]
MNVQLIVQLKRGNPCYEDNTWETAFAKHKTYFAAACILYVLLKSSPPIAAACNASPRLPFNSVGGPAGFSVVAPPVPTLNSSIKASSNTASTCT